jgi:hypothetical protein
MKLKNLEEDGGGLIAVIFWYFPVGFEEKYEHLSQDSRTPG